MKCLDFAVGLFRLASDPAAEARALLVQADCHWLRGEPSAAVETVHTALELLHPISDSRLCLFAHHNLCRYLCALDEVGAADALFQSLEPAYEDIDDRQIVVLRLWLGGVIAYRLGETERAESTLRTALDEYVRLPVPFFAALVAIDLALVLLDQERYQEVARLSACLPPLFESEGVRPEATAAVVLFHRAAARHRLNETILDRLREFFERARVDRSARLDL
jgi:tetratricopeptide (TPR) repeat protein